ncbi:hypothetical protein [Tissierella sp.]|uniref:hypothetical protein n=1 Tax=Tissierella sp. TaxID=41274 RepID=UPI0030579395
MDKLTKKEIEILLNLVQQTREDIGMEKYNKQVDYDLDLQFIQIKLNAQLNMY